MALTAACLEARRSTFPDASYEELSYDSRSNITGRRTRAARQITYAYDGAGRLTGTSYNSYGTGEGPVAYDYDGQGREVEIAKTGNSTSLITITYDALGRRASESQDGRTVSWQYDIAGRPTRLTWPDNFYVTYDHSPAAQLTAIRDSGGAALVSYGYDTFGRPTSLTRANGLVTAISYDPVARLSRLNQQGLVYSDFTYNPASQILTRTLSNGAWAWDEGLNVDLDYDVNNLNQYTEVGTTDYAYDLNGNLTDDGPNSYVYDPENRMRWSTRASPSQTVQLRYDGRGRLRRRWGSGSGTTDYVYDGDATIAEYNDATGAVLRRYIHGAGVDDPLIWYEGSGTGDRRFLHADERGSITTVTNNAGGIIARNIYDEWGVPGVGNIGRFQYTGQQWLPEIGLYYYKARFYAPAIGRFMQTDPIGYEDGMNLYAYVGNDPMNGSDANGTNRCAFKTCGDSALQGLEGVSAGGTRLPGTVVITVMVTGSQRSGEPDLDDVTVRLRVDPNRQRYGSQDEAAYGFFSSNEAALSTANAQGNELAGFTLTDNTHTGSAIVPPAHNLIARLVFYGESAVDAAAYLHSHAPNAPGFQESFSAQDIRNVVGNNMPSYLRTPQNALRFLSVGVARRNQRAQDAPGTNACPPAQRITGHVCF